MTNTNDYDAEIAIVGYGPTGVTAANRLGAYGIKTIVFEREKEIYPRARAVTVNDWTCRYFQAMGVNREIKQTMDETYQLRWITYDGVELNKISFPPSDQGHARAYSIYQPAMEQVLRDSMTRYSNRVDVQFGQDVVGIAQDENGVTLTIRDMDTGATRTMRARYLLGCHGGNHATREELGVELVGDTTETRWVVIDARVKRWWPHRNILTFWSDKNRPVVDIALAKGNHRWEFPLESHETDEDFQTHEDLWKLLNTLGVTHDDVEIHQHAFYNHHVRHAENWRLGRVFLLGDAAHLMPPWGGSGMQSGIRDAFCLAWKLANVLKGKLPEQVLDTYQAERAPDVARYTQITIELGKIIQQQLSDEEMAALQKAALEDNSGLHPLLQPPVLAGGWITGACDENSALGRLIPQPRAASSRGVYALLDDFLGDDMVLLGDGVAPETHLSEAQRADWDELGTRYIRVHGADEATERASDIVDLEGSLLGWMRQYGTRVIAVRPDRFVAATDTTGLDVPLS